MCPPTRRPSRRGSLPYLHAEKVDGYTNYLYRNKGQKWDGRYNDPWGQMGVYVFLFTFKKKWLKNNGKKSMAYEEPKDFGKRKGPYGGR